jgi:hypothetical protein
LITVPQVSVDITMTIADVAVILIADTIDHKSCGRRGNAANVVSTGGTASIGRLTDGARGVRTHGPH